MKGLLLHKWFGVFLQITVLINLILIAPLSFASDKTVLIIKSSDNSFFDTTVERLMEQTRAPVTFQVETLDSIKKQLSLLNSSSLIITMGLDAANYLGETTKNTPVIHSYITEFQYLRHQQHKNQYSILLDQPLQRYLSFIKQLITAKRIGIIRRQNNKISNKKLQQFTDLYGLKLQQLIFETKDNPLNSVRELLQTNDVLLSLPDPEVYNRQSLKGILLTSYRQNKPLISYSPSHVKSGALAAIFSSPENIGSQIAELLNKILGDKRFKPKSHYYAAEFDIRINHRVASSLGLKPADKEQIIRKIKMEQDK